MGLKKIGKATAPRSFGTGGTKLTPKNNVPNTLNNAQSTYKPSYQKKSAFDRLFDLANEVAATSMPKSAPKFALPTTASGIVRKANSDQFKTDPLDADKALSQKNLEETRKNMRLASARANVARRSGYAVNGIDLQQEQNKLSDLRKQAQGYQKDIDRVDYVQHFQDIKQDDDFLGQFWASYDMGRLGQDEALAWNDYLNNPTPQNRRYAEAVSEQAVLYQQRNQEALDNDAILPWITQDLARYIPQFIDQNIAGLKGLAGGAATGTIIPGIGTAVGGKIGYVAGRAAYGYDTMRGIAFKSLLDAGVDEETARAAANDEAFISSLIEGGDAAVDLLTLGGGKLIGSVFKQGAKTGAQVTKPMWKKILSGGAALLGNAAGEGAQEWTQEGVSLANQKREGSGLLDLVGATGGQIYDALSGQDPDALAQMNEAGAAGFRIGLMMGGGTKIANTALAAALNRSDQNQSGNVTLEQMADEIASDWANQTFGSYQDDSISFSQPTEQIQTQQEVPLLDRLRQQTSTLSNRQAEQVLSDRDAVATLQQKAGLDLSAQDTLAKRRSAVKQSFERYDTQQKRAETVQNNADMMNSFGENGQKAFVSEVRKTGDAAATYPEFSQAYVEGLTGAEQAADLSPTAQAAYYAGQNDAAARPKAQTTVRQAGFSESEYSGSVSEDDRSFYNALGKATGTRISVVAPTGNGGYNGYYENGEIYIAADAEDPGRVVVAHEVTHRLQEIAPEAYIKFRDYAMAAVAGQGGADAIISAYQSRYADADVTLTQEAAMDEIAADYAQRLMIDEEAIRRVVADDRSLAQKFVDTIKDLIERVKRAFSGKEARAEIKQLEKARDLWLDALKEGYAQKSSAVQADGEARFSIRYDQNNRPYVVIEEDILDSVPQKDWVKTVKDNLRQKFPNGVTVGNNVININAQSRREMTFSKYMQRLFNLEPQMYADKLRAANSADEILQAARNWVNEALLHPRKDDIIDFARGEVLMRIGSNGYTAQVIVGNRGENGLLLYDIINLSPANIREKAKKTDAAFTTNAQNGPRGRGPASVTDSIAENGGDVNARFSLKKPVEEAGNLIALHNITESKLIASLRLGSLPMPSLAVKKSSDVHSDFGEISLVFSADTIDPKVNAENRLYGADAWTPTEAPLKINPEFDHRKTVETVQRIKAAVQNVRTHLFDVDPSRFEKSISDAQGSIYSAYAEDLGMQTAYAIESGIIDSVPMKNGVVDKAALTDQIDARLNQDAEWRGYKVWLNNISDSIITSYDEASTGNIMQNMSAQPETAKRFNLSENGELTVPAAEYGSINELRRNKGRLSEDADAEARSAGQEFITWAQGISDSTGVGLKGVVDAINAGFSSRYNVGDILAAFGSKGIEISQMEASGLQNLYKKAVELPTPYFEAKPRRAVGFEEVLAAIVPDNSSNELISDLSNAGVETIEYRAGDNADRLEKVNSIDSAKFSLKGTSQLQRQVQNLQERNAYLKEQMKRSTSIKTDRKKTAAYAKQLAQAYESQYGADALTSDLLSIYDDIANAGSDVDMDSLTARARDIAGRVLEQSVREDTELYNEYAALRNYLRTTKINVPKSIHADLDMMGGYNQFRKSNMGRMKLSSSDGASIDTVYQELAQQYPGLFDEAEYTNPADQLINMADVLDGIQPVLENPYSSDMEMATRFVASEILESYFDIPQQKPTFADRQQARVEAARAAGNRRVSELREANRQNIAGIREQNRERISALRASNQQRIAQLREQGRQQVKNAIQRERAKRAEQIQALKEKYASKESAGRERRASREVRNKIERHVRAISQKLLTPTDKSNVPESLRKPVAALLDAINLESAYTVDPETGKRTKGGGGDPVKRTAAFMDLRKAYQEIMSSADGDMVVDPALLGDQASGFEGNFDKVIALRDKRLSDMSLTELDTVWQTVRAIEHSISTAGKNLAQSKFAGTVEWAKAMQSENAGKVQRSSTKRHWTLDLLTPITYFSRFGDSGVEVYRMLRNAQDRQQQMITDIRETTREIVSPADARKYRYETHEFVTDGGQELTLTTAQIMSIYELSKRKQAQGHLLSGGIYQPEVPGTKIRRGTEAIHLTEGDLAAIIGTLTDKQAKVADGLQKVMATTLADWGNEASMKAYGYKKFTGADYWPISVAREGVKTTVENSGMNTRSISNIGLAKATVPKASNPLNIEDAFTTFTQHAGDMTDYAAYLLPMEDASRLFNFRFKDGEGNYTGQTIKGLLNRVGGAQSDSYWTSLMDDIQNGTAARTDSQFSAGIQNLIGKTKGAAVGANLRVVAQQPTAFFRAAAILSPADLSRGVAGAPTKGSGWKKALKWAPIAQRKQIGGFEIGNGVRLETELFGDLSKGGKHALNKLDDISSTPAGKADEITWGRIWNACEWQVSKDKSIAKGSDEYYQATAKLFTRVIDESQVVDGVLQRSQIMRSNSALNKMATSFMGEPTMSLNIMMRAWDAMRYETDPQKRNATRRKFARAGTALIVSGVVNAMVQSLVDAERDKDQDKKYWDRVFSAFTGLTGEEETPWDRAVAVVLNSNVSGNINPLGQIPYVKDVLSLLQGYDVTRMDADAVGDFIKAGENVVKNISGDGPRTPAYAAKELLNAGAKVFGVSIGNLWRDASGIVNAIAVETDNTALMYEMAKAGYNLSNTTNKSRFLDIAFRAQEAGDTETYSRIAEDLISSGTVVDMDEFEKAMASRLKKTEAFAKAQASTQEELQKKIESTSIYSRFDSKTKEKAAEKIEAYAYAKQMGEENPDFDLPDSYNWVEKADAGASVGLTADEYILFDLAYSMLKSDEKEGGQTKQEKAIDLLEDMDLSNSERSYLFGTKYESDKNNPWK